MALQFHLNSSIQSRPLSLEMDFIQPNNFKVVYILVVFYLSVPAKFDVMSFVIGVNCPFVSS